MGFLGVFLPLNLNSVKNTNFGNLASAGQTIFSFRRSNKILFKRCESNRSMP